MTEDKRYFTEGSEKKTVKGGSEEIGFDLEKGPDGDLSPESLGGISTDFREEKVKLADTGEDKEVRNKDILNIDRDASLAGIAGMQESGGERITRQKELTEKNYWLKLIHSIRAEKLADEEKEDLFLQYEKIIQEVVETIAENFNEELKRGDIRKAVDLFKKAILPALKEENPEINEAACWDDFHAELKKWGEKNSLEDWS